MIERCQKLISHPLFNAFIFFSILLTALQAFLEFGVPNQSSFFLAQILFYFTQSVFIIEIILRLVASGPQYFSFFKNRRNIIDFVLVCISTLPLPAHWAPAVRIIRFIRVFRILSFRTYLSQFWAHRWNLRFLYVTAGFVLVFGLLLQRITFVMTNPRVNSVVTALSPVQVVCGVRSATKSFVSYHYCTQFQATVKFRTAQNIEQTAYVLNGYNTPRNSVGSQVEIMYSLSNPQIATINTFWDIWGDFITALAIYLGLILADLYLVSTRPEIFPAFQFT